MERIDLCRPVEFLRTAGPALDHAADITELYAEAYPDAVFSDNELEVLHGLIDVRRDLRRVVDQVTGEILS